MTKYPIGIQTFEKLRNEGFVYVDKTALIHRLVSQSGFFFLSRPRRFGKSLLLSTIEAYYRGQRELFKGLAIDSLTDDWEPHPVLHLDLNNREYSDKASLIKQLNSYLEGWEALYGDEKKDRDVEERFAYVIEKACEKTGKKVVILVDEYDKPLLNALGNQALSEAYRSTLKAFYSNLKTMDRYIEFAMLSGVARFSKVSIFSDLNNLKDISFSDDFASLCGITDSELDQYFSDGIASLASANSMDEASAGEALRRSYDGYHFSPKSPGIYNPYSLLNVFYSNTFGSYWFASGTPTYLVRQIRNEGWRLRDISGCRISYNALTSAGISDRDPIPAFYQSGYLTIKSFDPEFREFTLDYPNEEVKAGFLEFILPYYLDETESHSAFNIREFVRDVREGNIRDFMNRLDSMIASVPYSEKRTAPESHFQNIIYLIFTLMGFYAKIEQRTSDGRIDLTVETSGYIYIFEFKIDSTPEEAMRQIREKEYWRPFSTSGKTIMLIGASFNSTTRRLNGYIVEEAAN